MRAIAIGLTVTAMMVGFAQAASWQTYSDAAAGFSVQFPGKPDHKSQTVQMPVGPVPSSTTDFAKGPLKFVVEVDDYSGAKTRPDPQKLVESGVDAIKLNSKLNSQTAFDVPGGAGRDVTFTVGPVMVRARLYYAAGRAYTLMAMSDGKSGWPAVTAGDADKFFKSFALTKK